MKCNVYTGFGGECLRDAVVLVDVKLPCGHRWVSRPICAKHWAEIKREDNWSCMVKVGNKKRCSTTYKPYEYMIDFELIREESHGSSN